MCLTSDPGRSSKWKALISSHVAVGQSGRRGTRRNVAPRTQTAASLSTSGPGPQLAVGIVLPSSVAEPSSVPSCDEAEPLASSASGPSEGWWSSGGSSSPISAPQIAASPATSEVASAPSAGQRWARHCCASARSESSGGRKKAQLRSSARWWDSQQRSERCSPAPSPTAATRAGWERTSRPYRLSSLKIQPCATCQKCSAVAWRTGGGRSGVVASVRPPRPRRKSRAACSSSSSTSAGGARGPSSPAAPRNRPRLGGSTLGQCKSHSSRAPSKRRSCEQSSGQDSGCSAVSACSAARHPASSVSGPSSSGPSPSSQRASQASTLTSSCGLKSHTCGSSKRMMVSAVWWSTCATKSTTVSSKRIDMGCVCRSTREPVVAQRWCDGARYADKPSAEPSCKLTILAPGSPGGSKFTAICASPWGGAGAHSFEP
mmetsp:Transcript_6470/g.15328  ORF Transcript_6470/g.15328 Transcript_6470/m.15328 type:complete len:431 (-) Transcript_6470:13-1305(-)